MRIDNYSFHDRSANVDFAGCGMRVKTDAGRPMKNRKSLEEQESKSLHSYQTGS